MDVPTCEGCRERAARIAKLEAEVAELRQLVRQLQARLGQNASNSSIPPSANPPQAPPPVHKQPTGRKPGGQPGHTAHLRVRLPPERLTEPTVHYRPDVCAACEHDLPQAPGPDDPEPRWHQVVELPELPVQVTEYQAHGRTCPNGGEDKARNPLRNALQAWQSNPDLAGLRDKDAVAKLPERERDMCLHLWAEVEALLKRARDEP